MTRIKHLFFQATIGPRSWILLVLVISVSVYFGLTLREVKFNYNIESFFSNNDPEVEFYESHKEIFGNENDVLLIGIKNNDGIFAEGFLKKVEALTKKLSELEELEKVISPSNLKMVYKMPIGMLKAPVIHLEDESKRENDKFKIYNSNTYTGTFFSQDTSAITIVLSLKSGLNKKENEQLLAAVNLELEGTNIDEYHLAGRIHTQQYYIGNMKFQMLLFGVLALLLFIGSLYFIFRNVMYVVLSMLPVLVSLIWTFGLMSVMGIQVDLMLTLVPTLIVVISTSSSIHLITSYQRKQSRGSSRTEAIKEAVSDTGFPSLLNALSTGIGFLSLIMIAVVPIQRFGIFAAIGIILSFILGILLIPTLINLFKLSGYSSERKPSVKGLIIFNSIKV